MVAGGHAPPPPPARGLEGGAKCLRGAKLLLKQTAYKAYEVLQEKAQAYYVLITIAEFSFYAAANAHRGAHISFAF